MEVIRPDDIDVLWADILQERRAQDVQWGGPAHDDEHERLDWPYFLVKFLQRARASAHVDDATSHFSYESAMVKLAALAVAAVQSSRRKRQCQPAPDTATSDHNPALDGDDPASLTAYYQPDDDARRFEG